jgi:hypothetical protein
MAPHSSRPFLAQVMLFLACAAGFSPQEEDMDTVSFSTYVKQVQSASSLLLSEQERDKQGEVVRTLFWAINSFSVQR